MNYFYYYLVNNFILLCIVIVLSITLIRKLNKNKRTSIYLLIILFITVLLSVFSVIKRYIENETGNVFLTILLGSTLYILRPACLLVFIFLSGQKFKGPWFYILLIPFTINVLSIYFRSLKLPKHGLSIMNSLKLMVRSIGWVAIFRFSALCHILSRLSILLSWYINH